MLNLKFKSILLILLMVFLLVSAIMMSITTFKLANSKAFTWDALDKNKAKEHGVEASKFWDSNQFIVVTPTITNILGLVLVGLIFYMG